MHAIRMEEPYTVTVTVVRSVTIVFMPYLGADHHATRQYCQRTEVFGGSHHLCLVSHHTDVDAAMRQVPLDLHISSLVYVLNAALSVTQTSSADTFPTMCVV